MNYPPSNSSILIPPTLFYFYPNPHFVKWSFLTNFAVNLYSMKKSLSILTLIVILLAGGIYATAKTARKKSSNSAKRTTLIKSDVITGDFDGDGKTDRIWTEGRYDSDGYAVGKIKLCSDNPRLAVGLSWDNLMGVDLINIGKLAGSRRDLLGTIPYAMSTWCAYDTYIFADGKWKPALESFSVWLGDDESPVGVVKAKSGKPGYVGIYYNDMAADDDEMEAMFQRQYKEAKVKF